MLKSKNRKPDIMSSHFKIIELSTRDSRFRNIVSIVKNQGATSAKKRSKTPYLLTPINAFDLTIQSGKSPFHKSLKLDRFKLTPTLFP